MLLPTIANLSLSSRVGGLGLLLVAACSDSQGSDPQGSDAPALSSALRADLQGILDGAVADQVTPGAALYVASNGESWSAAAGVSDVERNTALTPDAHFRAGSIIKTLLATAILQDVEAGTLHLTDRLTERLPASVTASIEHAESVDLGMLLGHRSGIAEWDTPAVDQTVATDPTHHWTLDEILASVRAQPPVFEPGASFSYSNTNYILLGEILSAVEGESWRQVVRERVLAPAGLSQTSLPEVGDMDCRAPCAHGYFPFEGELLDLTRVDPSMAGASGGHALLTNLADLTQLLQRLRAGALFERPETLDAMFDMQPASDPDMPMTGYGFGVMQLEVDGEVVLGHLGGAPGYQSFLLYAPGTDRYVSGFINVLGDIGAVLGPVAQRITQP